jgi:hypothetical protein
MRTTKKEKKFAAVLTLAMLCWALMVGGPPAFAAVSEDVVVCARQGAQAQGGSEGVVVCARQGAQAAGDAGAPMSQSNQAVFRTEANPTAK